MSALLATESSAAPLARQLTGVLALLNSRTLESGDIEAGLREICQCANESLLATRTTVWHAGEDGARLYCVYRLVAVSGVNSAGGELREAELPGLFGELRENRPIVITKADDPLLKGLFADVEGNIGILIVPVLMQGRWVGAIMVERLSGAEWAQGEIVFCKSLTSMISRSMEATLRTKARSVQAVAERTRLLREMSNRLSVEANLRDQKLNVERELQLGAAIQEGINVSDLKPWNGISFAKSYLPMETISGDYIDIVRRADSVHMLVADVSGHGIPAAFWTMMAKQVFVEAIHRSTDPANAYESINEVLVQRINTADYLTSAMIKVDSTNTMTYSLAGHPELIHVRASTGEVTALQSAGFVLGVAHPSPVAFGTGTLRLRSGDKVLLYTDGITEQTNESGEQFGSERLMAVVRQYKEQPLQLLLDRILFALAEFMRNADVKDDISLLALELTPNWGRFVTCSNAANRAMKAGNLQEAISGFQEANQLVPTYPEPTLMLAKLYYRTGEYAECERYLELYRKVRPSCLRGISVAILIYRRNGNQAALKGLLAKLQMLAGIDRRAGQLAQSLKSIL
ncbi:MAG: SpoIIE family protein phosphatase [Leptospirales bacterium]|nr:SpoIIE family protein phosphatase [Leptospirales bacterium]